MEQADKIIIRNLIFSVILGVILSRFSIGSVLMTIPILLVCPKVRQTSVKVAAFAAILAGSAVWTVLQNRVLLGTEYWPVLLVGLYLPASLTIGSAIWTIGGNYSRSSMRKFYWASIPVFFIGTALALYFASDSSQNVRLALAESVLYYFPTDMLSVDISSTVKIVIDSMMLVFSPVALLLLAIPVVISDINLNRYDEDWQYDFANMKLPDYFVWILFGSWAGALVCKLVSGIPIWVLAVIWNLSLSLTVLYLIVGVSIVVAFARKRTAAITAGRIVFTVAIACLIPFLNVVVLIGLPLLGILETWINFR